MVIKGTIVPELPIRQYPPVLLPNTHCLLHKCILVPQSSVLQEVSLTVHPAAGLYPFAAASSAASPKVFQLRTAFKLT